ncbi:MAG: FecR domain-containing protein [Pseudomonadales bacterium]|jgi:transmembrane sensor|nr:FecR domain-containing protein [Pseudomonadales bacterium]
MSQGTRKVVDFPRREAIEEEAATWVVRRSGDEFGPEDERALAAWLATSERHRDAYQRLAAVWADAAVLEELDDLADAAEPLAPERRRSPSPGRWALAAAASVCLAIASVLWLGEAELPRAERAAAQDYVTGVGEQRTVVLADGSVLRLNTGTALSVDLSSSLRRIRLHQGEAFFEVAPDRRRPFSVESSAGSVRALGTAFSARLRGREHLEVTVEEGRVRVDPAPPEALPSGVSHAPLPEPIELSAGSAVVFVGEERKVEPVSERELSRRLSWRDGVVVFAGEPLRSVVEDVSRYTELEITIADPSIEALPIGGYFRIGEVEALLESLELVFGIEARRSDTGAIVLARAAP